MGDVGVNEQTKLNKVSTSELDSSRSIWALVTSNEFSGSMKGQEFFDQLGDC
jgi:hypothetical protein